MALALGLAAVVYFSNSVQAGNRRLGLALFFEGVRVGAGTGLLYLVTEERYARGLQAVGITAMLVLPSLYLWFLATLQTPWVRFLQTRTAQAVLLLAALAAEVAWFLRPEMFLQRMYQPSYAEWDGVTGPWFVLFYELSTIVYVFGLIVAVAAWRHASGEFAHRRAKAYAIAFGARDALYALFVLLRAFVVPNPTDPSPFAIAVQATGIPVITIVFVPLIAYGILKTQLFDIDLKIKWTLRNSTVAAIFFAVFFIVSESATEFLSSQAGPVWGIIAAGILILAISPLQRFADRFANAAMPNVSRTPEYLALRKLDVYRAAVEGAWRDGVLTKDERALLNHLRAELGIGRDAAAAVEGAYTAPRHRPPLRAVRRKAGRTSVRHR